MTAKKLLPTVFCALVLLSWPGARAAAQQDVKVVTNVYSRHLDQSIPGNDFEPIEIAFLAPAFADGPLNEIGLRCLATPRRDGVRVALGGIWLGGEIVDLVTGETLHVIPNKYKEFGPAALFAFFIPDLSAKAVPASGFYGIALGGHVDGTATANSLRVECRLSDRVPCAPSDTTACLLTNNRMKVRVDIDSGEAEVVASSKSLARFDVLDPGFAELSVRINNGCGVNDHYWVTILGATTEGFTVRVVDTQIGSEYSYTNPTGVFFSGAEDRTAFKDCP